MKKELKTLALVIGTELLKLRRTVALWLTILYPLGTVLLASLFMYSMRNNKSFSPTATINNINNVAAFFLPFYVILTISFFCQLEHRNNLFKHMISLPVPRTSFFFGKLIASLMLVALAWLQMILLTYLAMFVLDLIVPKLALIQSLDHLYLLTALGRTFLAAIAMVVIQYYLGLRMRNVVAPISIGTAMAILPIAVLFILGVTGLLSNPRVLSWLPLYNPYTYPYSHVFNIMSGPSYELDLFPSASLIYLLIAVVLAIAGSYEFKNRNFK
ncbi:MAG TPA: ABC transporter permease [Bacteroidales bacterium]|nr:ABC transporter permease [Bacteroidales bacterium]